MEIRKYLYEKVDYCPRCRKRTPHIKEGIYKMCKLCRYKEAFRLPNFK